VPLQPFIHPECVISPLNLFINQMTDFGVYLRLVKLNYQIAEENGILCPAITRSQSNLSKGVLNARSIADSVIYSGWNYLFLSYGNQLSLPVSCLIQ